MLQITSKTLGFQKIMVYKTPPGGGGGKPYLARGLSMMHEYIIFSVGGWGVAARICEIVLYKESGK